MQKTKFNFIFLLVGMVILFMLFLCSSLQAQKAESFSQAQKNTLNFIQQLYDRIDAGLLIRSGAVYQDTNEDGDSRSDIALTSIELGVNANINDNVSADVVYLYEDPTFDEEDGLGIDSGTITLDGGDACPGYISLGKMYVPYGALLTRFPDNPLTTVPVSLTMGEINEKAALVGYEKEFLVGSSSGKLSLSGYTFNGDIKEFGDSENSVDDFGADINFTFNKKEDTSFTIGGSYISNLADTDTISETLEYSNGTTMEEVDSMVDGYAAYLSCNVQNLFLDAEYMSALDDFKLNELATSSGDGAEPSVWNVETGFNYDWGRNLEVALKYAGSDEADGLDIPESRYGITFNQEIFENTVFSVGTLFDEFETEKFDAGSEDSRSTVFSQIEVEL